MLMPSIFRENLMDDFWRDPFRDFSGFQPTNDLMKTDIKDKEDSYELSISLPGVKKEDIQAELKDGYLTISATSAQENDEKDENDRYIRRERYYGSATRSFYVGENVEQEDIKAKYESGILTLNVPKAAAKPEVEEKKYIAIEG